MKRFFSVAKSAIQDSFFFGEKRAIQDSDLLKILQSEIDHELSSNRFQNGESGSLGDFVLEWDSQRTQDILLRKKCESGEEVAVSALLGEDNAVGDGGDEINRKVLMKVGIKKPSLSSILLFSCEASRTGVGKSNFNIQTASCIPSTSTVGSPIYSPVFRDLDFTLQDGLKKYLEARGIGETLTNFVIFHLHKKEHNQYVNWLQKLKGLVEE